MSFKDQMTADIDSLFTPDEMAEETTVNGVPVVIIGEEKRDGKSKDFGGYERHQVNVGYIKFYIRENDITSPPVVGGEIEVDGTYYEITASDYECGSYIISAEVRK